MSLIDLSYFNGEILIPTANSPVAAQKLADMINYREPYLLKKLMGFAFYTSFMNGINSGYPIDQKWLNLLNGCTYTDLYGNTREWVGLISVPANMISATLGIGAINVVVDRGTLMDGSVLLDPISGTNTINIPVSLQGKPFAFSERQFGPFRTDEFSIINGGTQLQFTGSKTFSTGDTYFWNGASITVGSQTGVVKKSLIANYVYYWFMRDNYSFTTAIGEKRTNTENSVQANPNRKLIRSWNEMVDWMRQFYAFVWAKASTDYPDWTTWVQNNGWYDCWAYGNYASFSYWPDIEFFKKINILGI